MAKKLFVGNIAWSLTEDKLREAFGQFGEIEDAVILTDRDTGRSKGFGFVTFTNDADADAAIAGMHEQELDGRPLTVNEARPKPDRY